MRVVMVAALIAPLAACATITRGTSQAFTVETEPSGAAVQTSNGLYCPATPCTFAKVDREAEFTVTITKDGYEPASANVTHETAGGGAAGMAGNVILGGLIGAAIDANSGATQQLVPNPLRVTLTPIGAAAAAPADPAAAEPTAAAPAEAEPAAAEPATTPPTQ